jgi:hypothetical protein
MTHARALLTSTPEGVTSYLEADVREPGVILSQAREMLDFTQPIGLMMFAVLHFIQGDGAAQPLVDELLAALPSGSYLTVTHATLDFSRPEEKAGYESLQRAGNAEFWTRGEEEFGAFFGGLELVKPGIVPITEWRPEPGTELPPRREINIWGAVGRKP